MKTMNIKSTDYRVQITESGSVPGSVLAAIRKASVLRTLYSVLSPVLCTLCSALLISSCTHDEITPPVNTTNDALALLPGDTRVGIKAEITDNREQSTTTRAEGDESVTTYYALDEIHADKDVDFIMYLPGASDESNLQRSGTSTLNTLATTEPFSTLMLKDFNLTEGDDCPVSRWTVLNANNSGIDNLWGWARLTADANGQPVLNYAMQRGNAKVTIIVQDKNGQPVDVSGDKVTATVSLPETLSEVIYTPEGETAGKRLSSYLLYEVKTLADDEAIDPNRIALGTYTSATKNTDFTFYGMVTANGTGGYYGGQSNTLTGIVSATATHTTTNGTFTPIAGGPQFTDTDKLTITVADDYSGLTSSQTGGTYSLKLSDVKLSDTEYLTALEPGKHYTLTVTLLHNTLVAATATIGAWSTASASANIGGDGAKISYTYDAETNTYTILEDAGIEKVLADMKANADRADATVMMNGVAVTLAGDAASLNAWAAAANKAIKDGTDQPNLVLTADITLPATTAEGTAITVDENGMPSGINWAPVGSLDYRFTGTIDGHGHTISGLRISGINVATGFVGYLGEGGVVKNLTLADAVVYSTLERVGAVAGHNYGTVENCHVAAGSSVATTVAYDALAGGIVGYNSGLLMGCTHAAAVTGTDYVGGIVGYNGYGGSIIACANTGAVNYTGSNSSSSGRTYACWSTATDDLDANYGDEDGSRTACYLIGTTITAVDNSTAVATIADVITAMNAAIDSYNASAAEGKTCPYRWTAGATETANPVLTTSSNE